MRRLSRLKAKVASSTKRGAIVSAKVLDVAIDRATVRIARNGARLTMIPVIGNVEAGDEVFVDYSSGTPLVKAAS